MAPKSSTRKALPPGGDVVLYLDNIVEATIVSLRPKVVAVFDLGQLRPDADGVAQLVLLTHSSQCQASPLTSTERVSIAVITAFATITGLLAGGLFTLRPDHDPIIHRAKSATGAGRWFVVVHTREPEQRERAERVLSRFGNDTLRTI